MLTFREIQTCEGYYYNPRTGDILRNVGPGQTLCWPEGSWTRQGANTDLDVPQFELLTADVTVPFPDIEREVVRRFGHASSGRILLRQTAVQAGGEVVTEEAEIHPARLERHP